MHALLQDTKHHIRFKHDPHHNKMLCKSLKVWKPYETHAQSNTSLQKTKHCISVKHNLCHNKMLSYLHGLSLSNTCTIKCLASKYQTLYILQAQYWKHDEWQRFAQLTCIASRHQTSCTFQAQSSPHNKMLCNLWKFEDLIKHAQANVTYFQSKVREYRIFCLFK